MPGKLPGRFPFLVPDLMHCRFTEATQEIACLPHLVLLVVCFLRSHIHISFPFIPCCGWGGSGGLPQHA